MSARSSAAVRRRSIDSRKTLVWLHRYAGLGMALFLVLAGVTGSVLVFEEELDRWLNPQWFALADVEPAMPAPALIARLQQQAPGTSVSTLMLPAHHGQPAMAYVRQWNGVGGARVNQVFLHPASGDLLGGRSTIEPRLNSREAVRWIYQFHYQLTLGQVGRVLLGCVALVWLLDCLWAFYLTLPRNAGKWWQPPFWKKWKPAWRVQRKRLNFDLHRASGLWLYPLLLVLAFSSVYFNLRREVFDPLLSVFTTQTQRPFEQPPLARPLWQPAQSWQQAIEAAKRTLEERSIAHALQSVHYNPQQGYYRISFNTDFDLSPDVAGARVYVDGNGGQLVHLHLVGQGTAGDIIADWQFPLHSGKAFGWAGRLLIFVGGLLIAVLALTGVVIWWRKRCARQPKPRRQAATQLHTAHAGQPSANQ
jgi:uncharacterized iron-regulated membrane protein